MDPLDVAMDLGVLRNLAWATGFGWRVVKPLFRRKEPPVFDVQWRFYDQEPGEGNAVGVAKNSDALGVGASRAAGFGQRTAPANATYGDRTVVMAFFRT